MSLGIKMVVFDLDGTLLRNDKTISEYTLGVLRQCKVAGIKIVYATARGRSAREIMPSALFDGEITMNGANIFGAEGFVHTCYISHETARPFLLALNRADIHVVAETNDAHYSNFIAKGKKFVDFHHHTIDSGKIFVWIRNSEDIEIIKQHIPDELYLQISHNDMAMIMHKNAQKSKAVSVLANKWGVKQCEIIAFGNDVNDIDLLTYAKLGIATENALDKVKEISGYICGSNNEDGVAKWLHQHIL